MKGKAKRRKRRRGSELQKPANPRCEPERTKKDFISLQGLLLLLFIINFSLLFSIFDLQNQRQSSICPFPFLNFLPGLELKRRIRTKLVEV
ncbi:hypothetical protein Peur_066383 [Populus x canadensis]